MSNLEKEQSSPEKASAQFIKRIFPLEVEQISLRQKATSGELRPGLFAKRKEQPGLINFGNGANPSAKDCRKVDEKSPATETHFCDVVPSTDLGLVGLALSGGGIRSATFNLGVIQALAEKGIFQQADYLSTVSGGGYFGGCLSSVFNKPASANEQNFPFGTNDLGEERQAVKHLRNNSNYLAPRGLRDYIRIPALLLRGILVNFLVLFPYLVAAVWVTKWFGSDYLKSHEYPVYFYPAMWAAILLLFWIGISPLLQTSFTRLGDSVVWRNRFERSFGGLLLATLALGLGGLAFAALSGYHLMENSRHAVIEAIRDLPVWSVAAAMIPFLFAGKASQNISKLRGKLGLLALGLLAPMILFWVFLELADWGIFHPEKHLSSVAWLGFDWFGFSMLTIPIWLFTLCFVDVNKTSLHSFYRDRLSKAYLIQVSEQDKTESICHNDTIKLSALNADGALAPYHLINATLNLQSSNNPDLRGRNADFFLFSKYAVGSNYTGYCATCDLEAIDARLDLGTAIAISGAAAAPNMGSTTIKPLVGVLTLLNVRLGRWLPNPRYINDPKVPNCLFKAGAAAPLLLLSEFFSQNEEKKAFVNISDGGHIENLGIYELLRRRCKFIIASDAEADVNLSFGGLATLIRHASIDMGIEIEMELEEVRKSTTGFSRKKCALGKIRYPKVGQQQAETGYLLYIKSSISGTETEYIREYRTRSTDFPHETTGDQFFNETQFEAYRALGYDSAKTLFSEQSAFDEQAEKGAKSISVESWFQDLTFLLRPRFAMHDKFAELQRQLSAVEREFNSPDVAAYTYQLYPEISPARNDGTAFSNSLDPRLSGDKAAGDEQFRKIFHLCNLQMQLMENAFVNLELDCQQNREHYFNRGWMNLFRRWSQAAYFQRAWAVTIGNYSVGFQKFCEDALRLEAKIVWEANVAWNCLTQREKEYLTNWGLYQAGGEANNAGYQIWVARMCNTELKKHDVQNDMRNSFPIGVIVLDLGTKDGVPELLFYRIRDYYRQMRLFERMLQTLRAQLPTTSAKNVLESNDTPQKQEKPVATVKLSEKDFAQYAYIFRHNGFTVAAKPSDATV